jgi:hypothetical protein
MNSMNLSRPFSPCFSFAPLPRSGLRSFFPLFFIWLFMVENVGAFRPLPFLSTSYRGDGEVELARLGDMPITERDVFLFRLLTRAPDPDLAAGWQNCPSPLVCAERRAQLRRAVQDMAMVYLQQSDIEPPLSPYQMFLARRWMMYPVYVCVWMDEVVAAELKIHPEDIQYYIRRNQAEFTLPARYEFFWASIPSPEEDKPDLRRGRRQEAEELLQRWRADKEITAIVTSDYPPSTTLVARNALYSTTRNSGVMDPLIETALRQLRDGEISPIIETRDGFHLVKLHAHYAASLRPEAEIQSDARKTLFLQFLPQQGDHLLSRLRHKVHPVDRSALWSFLAPETIMLDIGRTDVTRDDFTAIFPELFPADAPPDSQRIRARAAELIDWELIAQNVELLLLDNHVMIRSAQPWADALVSHTRARLLPAPEDSALSEGEISALWNRHREEIHPSIERRYYKLSVSLRGAGDSPNRPEAFHANDDLFDQFDQFRKQASELLQIYRAAANGAALDANPVLSRWRSAVRSTAPRQAEDLGFRTVRAPGPLTDPTRELPLLKIGEISAPRYESPGIMAMYFAVDSRPRPEPPAAHRARMVRHYVHETRLAEQCKAAFEEALNSGEFRWSLPLAP